MELDTKIKKFEALTRLLRRKKEKLKQALTGTENERHIPGRVPNRLFDNGRDKSRPSNFS